MLSYLLRSFKHRQKVTLRDKLISIILINWVWPDFQKARSVVSIAWWLVNFPCSTSLWGKRINQIRLSRPNSLDRCIFSESCTNGGKLLRRKTCGRPRMVLVWLCLSAKSVLTIEISAGEVLLVEHCLSFSVELRSQSTQVRLFKSFIRLLYELV